ncbi:putative DNA-binding transcriptional regulator AlpA [Microbacterium resistens]|uniref:DNA-binding transcriptional regulator AlpA n=1 Tax=Microbacterium resistens TaxID=156977 RepID=A0ABU1SHY5_9MICO|nr:helix-turn-helix domain-containing protein [Microbacterium resistens]MDR6868938.1 putative DNA-binding transcriptional regulator AlpA [Microbacterium resistens]
MTKIIDIKQTHVITGLAVQTLYNMRSNDDGPPSFTIRGRVRYYEEDVFEWVRQEAERSRSTVGAAK